MTTRPKINAPPVIAKARPRFLMNPRSCSSPYAMLTAVMRCDIALDVVHSAARMPITALIASPPDEASLSEPSCCSKNVRTSSGAADSRSVIWSVSVSGSATSDQIEMTATSAAGTARNV